MISKELKDNINTLRIDARRCGLEQMTVEHLTLILIKENSSVRKILADSSADTDGLKIKLDQYINSQIPQAKTYGDEPQPTDDFNRVLERALSATTTAPINGLHVLAAVFSEPDSYAAYYMQKYGIERLMLLSKLSQYQHRSTSQPAKKTAKQESDLVMDAKNGKIEKPSGRDSEVNQLMHTLSCKYKNNALLTGEPGVGKTTIVHALAHRIADGDVPAHMLDMRIMPVSVSEMVAGTKYRGDFEQRIQQMVEKCRSHGNTVIFIDEVHTLIGAGAVSGGTLDGANILKPLLEEKDVRYIGITTQAEYRRIFEKDLALARRFKKIDIREPDDNTLMVIMKQAIKQLTQHHNVSYSGKTAAAAIEASRRYLPNRHLPDKAIALLDEAGAYHQLSPQSQPIDSDTIEQLARNAAGLSPAGSSLMQLSQLAANLMTSVIEQEEAAQRLARAVLMSKLNYNTARHVVGSFLFYGPTGVGKTEMARQLAQQLELPLLRYDMSEYMERHAVSRLIGAPPGYVGFEQSGKLVEDVVGNPAAIILFDEIEKAHPDVLNILLQILDYGTLTDNSGRIINFSGTLIILTSNLSSAEMERGIAGFDRDSGDYNDDAIRHFFSPEMRNRLDALIRFNPLSVNAIAAITDKQLALTIKNIAGSKDIHITIDAKLKQTLKQDGYTPAMGARPLQRLIKEKILEPLAIAEANGNISAGGKYHLSAAGVTAQTRHKKRQRRKETVTA